MLALNKSYAEVMQKTKQESWNIKGLRESHACNYLQEPNLNLLIYIGFFHAYPYSICNTLGCCLTNTLLAFMPARDGKRRKK